jgi:hypothetical protein
MTCYEILEHTKGNDFVSFDSVGYWSSSAQHLRKGKHNLPTKITNFLPRSTIVTFISHVYESAKLVKFGQAIMDVREDGYFSKIDKHTSSCRIFPTV